ncbi:DsbA family protein, partial [Mesorhizobium sp. M1C.F.Ca.ET.144.01.1.1]
MIDITVTYLFDPLCGWCYGATPMLDRLAASGVALELLPTGLFSASGARPMDAGFAAQAWAA